MCRYDTYTCKYTKAHILGGAHALCVNAYKYWPYPITLFFVPPRGSVRVLGSPGRVPIGFFVGTCAREESLLALHVHARQCMLIACYMIRPILLTHTLFGISMTSSKQVDKLTRLSKNNDPI